MTHYDDETLAGVALGEEDDPALWAHLQECGACSESLAALQRTLSIVTGSSEETLSLPPPELWDRIEAQTATGTTQRRPSRLWISLALAAGLAIGAVGATVVNGLGESDPAPAVAWTTQLQTAQKQSVGSAEVLYGSTGVDLRVQTAAVGKGPGYLEVWLINRDRNRMVSIGILSPQSTSQTFVISQALLDEGYVIVDVSREPFDTKPDHSGDTLFRGTLTA